LLNHCIAQTLAGSDTCGMRCGLALCSMHIKQKERR